MLHPFLNEKLPEITKMFKEHHVKSAYAFGSVVTDKFNEESDIDFLLNFDETIEPVERGELWWSLYYALKDYLQRDVDIVTGKSLKNPYFIEVLNETKQVIYES